MCSYSILRAKDFGSINLCDSAILDVRTDMEHAEKHLACSHDHVPLERLNPKNYMVARGLRNDTNVFILCRSGKRAAQAAEKFVAEGYPNVHVVEGGIVACESCGHDIRGHVVSKYSDGVSNKNAPIPLERQVRIVAGAITAGGALLALLSHPFFGFIPLFVGAGLIFAGVTDRCGMALILTKAPWNVPKKHKNCLEKGENHDERL